MANIKIVKPNCPYHKVQHFPIKPLVKSIEFFLMIEPPAGFSVKTVLNLRTANGKSLPKTWLLESSDLSKTMVCKSILKSQIRDIAVFRKQMERINSLKIPGVLLYSHMTEDPDYFFLFRPYISNPSLEDILNSEDKSQEAHLFGLWIQITEVYLNLHNYQIAPSNISPKNIFLINGQDVVVTDISPVIRDMDSIMQHPNLREIGLFPPEFFTESLPTPASDSWSLGMILILLLTKNLPWKTKNVFTMIQKINNCEIDLPTSISAQIRKVISVIIVKDPTKRPSLSEILQMSKHPHFLVGEGIPLVRPRFKGVKKVETLPLTASLEMLKFKGGSTQIKVKMISSSGILSSNESIEAHAK